MRRVTSSRDVDRVLREAVKIALDDTASKPGDDFFARGLSTEGFAGGYAQALMDVEAFIRHGQPQDSRRVFSRAVAQAAFKKNTR